MPYIKWERRDKIFNGTHCQNPGELNFLLTRCIIEFLDTHGLSYQRINDVLGALEGAKLEFYHRVVVDYEEGRMSENGDIYDT